MPQSGVIRFLIIASVSLIVHFIAGFIMDLPPYGIMVKNTDVHIKIDEKRAVVNAEIMFQCVSPFPRKNEFLFPIYTSEIQGRADNIRGIEEGEGFAGREADFRKTEAGVIYRLNLKPGEQRKVRFTFEQKVSGYSFVCNFTKMTGRTDKADTVNYTVEVPGKYALHTMPAHNIDVQSGDVRIFTLERKEMTDPGLFIKWNRGE